MKTLLLTSILTVFAAWAPAQAATILFSLEGSAGSGLLPGNETGILNGTPGSGGVVGSGISFDDLTMTLSIDIGWGSGNGFTDLTGVATAGHIHGPTASGGTAAFVENAGPLLFLSTESGWDASASSGGFQGDFTLTAGQAIDLMDGKLYINVHTATNGGGEIRGNLVVVPEPSSSFLIAAALGTVCLRRRRH